MNPLFYAACRRVTHWIARLCIRQRVLFADRAEGNGQMLLAVTHLSHLEPLFITHHLRRPVRWMARVEYFGTWWGRLLLHRCGAFAVDRFGLSLRGVRRAIELVEAGGVVGVFPEGEVTTGATSMLRGGPMKQGIATISIRTGVPILPVTVIGTEKLNRVWPWIPAKRGSIVIAFGEPVYPPASRKSNRRTRRDLAEKLGLGFVSLYGEILADGALRDEDVP